MEAIKWCLNNDLLLTEINRSNPNIFIKGKIGIGKTNLINYLIESVVNRKKGIISVYTYKKSKYYNEEHGNPVRVIYIKDANYYLGLLKTIEDLINERLVEAIKNNSKFVPKVIVFEDIDLVFNILELARSNDGDISGINQFKILLEYIMRVGPSLEIYNVFTGQEVPTGDLNRNLITQTIEINSYRDASSVGDNGCQLQYSLSRFNL